MAIPAELSPRVISLPVTPSNPPPAGPAPQPPAGPVDQFAASAPAPALPGFLAKQSLSRTDVVAIANAVGRPVTLGELAQRFPAARLDGRGAPLAELARASIQTASGPQCLGQATVDRNGDLEVTPLLRAELAAQNPNLILRKDDELPVPLAYTLAHGTLVVRDRAGREALAGAGLARGKGDAVQIDLSNMDEVRRALVKLGFNPEDAIARQTALAQQGVSVPLSDDDQLRRVLLGRLDSAENEVDIDDRTVLEGGEHNGELRPTVYGSAKVSPAHPDEVILTYKRFNNQSYASQGTWVTKLFRKDDRPQHEFDSEATFVKLDAHTGEREAVLAARHYYGELSGPQELQALAEETGRADLTTSVSPKAHGSRLAENETVKPWAGHGEDGVKRSDPRDHVFKDLFLGFKDTGPGGPGVLIPSDAIDLVMECDDQQTLNLATQIGQTKRGLMGTKVLDMFNDGLPVDRFGGTDWYYRQEALQSQA